MAAGPQEGEAEALVLALTQILGTVLGTITLHSSSFTLGSNFPETEDTTFPPRCKAQPCWGAAATLFYIKLLLIVH